MRSFDKLRMTFVFFRPDSYREVDKDLFNFFSVHFFACPKKRTKKRTLFCRCFQLCFRIIGTVLPQLNFLQGFKNFTPGKHYTCKKEVFNTINLLGTIMRQFPTLDIFFITGLSMTLFYNTAIAANFHI
jgi:hypothetical protein